MRLYENVSHGHTSLLKLSIRAGLVSTLACGLHAQTAAITAQSELQPSASESTPAAVISPLDHSVFAPTASAPLGQADAAAATELKAANSALAGSTSWTGLQATGTITYATDPTQFNVTLSNLGSNKFRLDTQTQTGVESIRISGRVGRVQSEDGTVTAIDPDTAIMGIFPFEILTKGASPGKNTALVDHGTASTATGQSAHRVTFELSSILRDPATKSQKTLPIDLYFDPATHLLIKSVSSVLIPGARLVPFLSVVTYSDYRTVGTSLIPFHYVETINGQPYRTLQLTSAQTNPTLSQTYFQFERSNQ